MFALFSITFSTLVKLDTYQDSRYLPSNLSFKVKLLVKIYDHNHGLNESLGRYYLQHVQITHLFKKGMLNLLKLDRNQVKFKIYFNI